MNLANKQPRADSNPDLSETHCSCQRTMDGVTLSFIRHSYGNSTGALTVGDPTGNFRGL